MSELTTYRCPGCGAPARANDVRCAYCGSLLFISEPGEIALPAIANAQQVAGKMRERIALNPYDGDAYYQLGLASFTLGLYENAEAAFQQAKRYLPGSAVAHYFCGLSMLLAAQDEILSIAPFQLRRIQRELETAIEADPQFRSALAYLKFVQALGLRNKENYAGAIPLLQESARALPELALIWKVLAACQFQIGNLHGVIDAGKRALELHPDDEAAAYMVGAAHARLEQFNEMELYARRVARLRGDESQWYRVVREFQGKFD